MCFVRFALYFAVAFFMITVDNAAFLFNDYSFQHIKKKQNDVYKTKSLFLS